METEFKGLLHLSRAEYTTLSTTGTLTKGGQTFTFDPLGTEYVVPKEASGGGVTMDLLWENAVIGASFNRQRVSIDMSAYDFIVVEVQNLDSPLVVKTVVFKKPTNNNTTIYAVDSYESVFMAVRPIKYESSEALFFEHCMRASYTSIGSWEQSDGNMKPAKIYGIKL